MPVGGIAGDQQAALFGQACFDPGAAKSTYGTGCFVLMNTGGDAPASKERLITTVAWKLGGSTTYALEGSIFIGGAVVQWLRDGLGLIRSAAEVEPLAATVEDNGDVYFVPAFTGPGRSALGPARPRADRRADPRHRRRATSPGPRWKGSPSRWPTCWTRWSRDAGTASSPSCGWTAAPPPTIC